MPENGFLSTIPNGLDCRSGFLVVSWAYAKWHDLPKHYSGQFDANYTAMAEA